MKLGGGKKRWGSFFLITLLWVGSGWILSLGEGSAVLGKKKDRWIWKSLGGSLAWIHMTWTDQDEVVLYGSTERYELIKWRGKDGECLWRQEHKELEAKKKRDLQNMTMTYDYDVEREDRTLSVFHVTSRRDQIQWLSTHQGEEEEEGGHGMRILQEIDLTEQSQGFMRMGKETWVVFGDTWLTLYGIQRNGQKPLLKKRWEKILSKGFIIYTPLVLTPQKDDPTSIGFLLKRNDMNHQLFMMELDILTGEEKKIHSLELKLNEGEKIKCHKNTCVLMESLNHIQVDHQGIHLLRKIDLHRMNINMNLITEITLLNSKFIGVKSKSERSVVHLDHETKSIARLTDKGKAVPCDDHLLLIDLINKTTLVFEHVDEHGNFIERAEHFNAVDTPSIDLTTVSCLKDKNNKLKILVQYSDLKMEYYDDMQWNPTWIREESLANIKQFIFMDLPDKSVFSPLREEFENGASSLWKRTTMRYYAHFLELKAFTHDLMEGVLSTLAAKSDKPTDLVSDKFGFRKMILVSTHSNKLLALDTLNGKILWSKTYANISNVTGIRLLKKSAYYPPELLILAQLSNDQHAAIIINALNGMELRRDALKNSEFFQILEGTQLVDKEHRHIQILVNFSGDILVYPESLGTKELLESAKTNLTFHVFNQSAHDLRGYGLVEAANRINTELLWMHQLQEDEQLMTFASKYCHGSSTSLGRILSDRRVLYKYLNNNMGAYIVTNSKTGEFRLVLRDMSSGLHLYEMNLLGPLKNALLVACENWIVYYTLGEDLVNRIGMIELFESSEPDVRIASQNFSSFNGFRPFAMEQSYLLPTALQSLAITNTHQGIASRLIVGINAPGQIIAIPKAFLDPMRSITKEINGEDVLPYEPTIAITSKQVISAGRPLDGLHCLATSPTKLESTSLIFAYGSDIFLARVSPSGAFDMLTEDFNKPALLFTVFSLLIGTYISYYLSKRKQLNKRWA